MKHNVLLTLGVHATDFRHWNRAPRLEISGSDALFADHNPPHRALCLNPPRATRRPFAPATESAHARVQRRHVSVAWFASTAWRRDWGFRTPQVDERSV